MRAPLSSSLASVRELRAARNKWLHRPFLFSLLMPNFSGSHYLREAVQNDQVTAYRGSVTLLRWEGVSCRGACTSVRDDERRRGERGLRGSGGVPFLWIPVDIWSFICDGKDPQEAQVTLNLKICMCVQIWLSYDSKKEHAFWRK